MNHLGTITLETDRLLLRRFIRSDAPAMFRNWACDSEVTKFLTWPAHADEAVSLNYIESMLAEYGDPTFYNWAIVLKSLGAPIGAISVVRRDDSAESVHIGYCIGRPWWNQGITSEALAAVIRFFFEQVGAGRIDSRHDPRNPGSGKVMENCGLTREGILRRSDWNNQGVCDAVWYAILREDYFEKKGVTL